MSFQRSTTQTTIANSALRMLPGGTISDFEENSFEASVCKGAYYDVVGEMLEKHHWGLATKRTALVAVTNDRLGEWAFAYAKPSDMAFPVFIIPSNGSAVSIYMGLSGSFYTRTNQPLMKQVGNTIYTNIQDASIEYTSFNITEGDFTNLFRRAVEIELAARICLAITKDAGRHKLLLQEAEGFYQRTVAQDLNRDRPTYGNSPTESEMTRFGGGSRDFVGSGYALDPVALPANTG